MKYFVLLLQIAAVSYAPVVGASTVVCKDIRAPAVDWVESRAPQSDLIFLGKVVNEMYVQPPIEVVEGVEDTNMLESLEELRRANEAHHPYQDVTFKIEKTWKGAELDLVTVRQKVIPGVAGSLLYGGRSYLVFGYKQTDGSYVFSSICSQTKRKENAADQIEVLDKLFRKSG